MGKGNTVGEKRRTLSGGELERLRLQLIDENSHELMGAAFRMSRWVSGGEPGTGSERIDVRCTEGNCLGERVTVIYDFTVAPPACIRTWKGQVPGSIAAAALQALFASNLFSNQFSEEDDRGVADLLKETWKLEALGVTLERTFFGQSPPSLAETRSLFQNISETAEATWPSEYERSNW